MKSLEILHPLVCFLYFAAAIGLSMFFMHPTCLLISFFCAFMCLSVTKGKKKAIKNVLCLLPMLLFAALLNPLLNHKGLTVITYLPDGNPLTGEAFFYGVASALMLGSVILWFQSFNVLMTGDKLTYLFGKIIPSLSLIISMTLRFVPRFYEQMKKVIAAQKCMGRDVAHGNAVKRAKTGLSVISVMTSWALESSIDTADSMKSRGYGLRGRTSFSVYSFGMRDVVQMIYLLAITAYIIVGGVFGAFGFEYYPSLVAAPTSVYSLSVFFAYLLLLASPEILCLEERKWNVLRSKI